MELENSCTDSLDVIYPPEVEINFLDATYSKGLRVCYCFCFFFFLLKLLYVSHFVSICTTDLQALSNSSMGGA